MAAKKYFPRTLELSLSEIGRHFPALMITGPRQVGKTTFLRHLSNESRTYVTLDDPSALTLAREDPALFFQAYRPPLLIDEIQYAPGLLPYIKMEVDKNHEEGAFWLTGSQQFHLMKGVSESLAGRVAVVQLLGLSRREMIGQPEASGPFLPLPEEIAVRLRTGGPLLAPDLFRQIWRGGFPSLAANPGTDWNLYYASYVQTYLQRDVRDLARVGDEAAFLRFMRAAAARTGQLLNLSDLAKDTGVTPMTAKSWLSILETSGIVYLLEPWFNNLTKRIVKTPKLYFLDTGLCAYLTKWMDPDALAIGAMSGAILETWILSELLKGYWHTGKSAPFYFYRDKDQKEIDLLIVQDGAVYPLEFKKTASPRRDDVRHFQVLKKLGMPVGPGGLICLAEKSLPLGQDVLSIPVSAL
jgi:predicted AAA+ superfamily ATPase